MKKLISILTLLLTVAFTSCKKDYTCECTTTIDGSQQSVETSTITDTKSDAEAECNEMDMEDKTLLGADRKRECEIK